MKPFTFLLPEIPAVTLLEPLVVQYKKAWQATPPGPRLQQRSALAPQTHDRKVAGIGIADRLGTAGLYARGVRASTAREVSTGGGEDDCRTASSAPSGQSVVFSPNNLASASMTA
jgi:hypothetical protein